MHPLPVTMIIMILLPDIITPDPFHYSEKQEGRQIRVHEPDLNYKWMAHIPSRKLQSRSMASLDGHGRHHKERK